MTPRKGVEGEKNEISILVCGYSGSGDSVADSSHSTSVEPPRDEPCEEQSLYGSYPSDSGSGKDYL